jgi:hypothetical protein
MKKTAVLFVSLLCVLPSMAADTYQVQVKGNLASYYSITQSGCIATNRFVLAADEGVRLSGGNGTTRRTLFVSEYQFDACIGVEVQSASGFMDLTKNEFTISGGGARLMASLPMTGTLGSETRHIDLAWEPTEKLWNGAYTTKYVGPGYTVLTRYNGSSQAATVTGTIGDEPVNVDGNMDLVKTGLVTIFKQ